MSKQNDDQDRNDEARFYPCCKKFEKMTSQVRQPDDIVESMNAARSKSFKKKRNYGGSGSCSSSANGSVSADKQENLNQVMMETIIKFLNDLNEDCTNNDPKPSDP